MRRAADDVQLGEAVLDAVRRYDASMSLLVPDGGNPDVERYLARPLREYLASGGKRLRPLLCELGCELVGGDREQAAVAARALEGFHAAALIHDDIEDASPVRRGRPSFHMQEGVPGGINAGDYGLALAFKTLMETPGLSAGAQLRVLGECVDAALRTIEGQAVDIGWARDGRFDVSVDDCLFVCEAKSAYYTCAAPLAIGCIIGGGSDGQVESLRSIGLDMGVAFQLKDDLLNLQGNPRVTGKGSFNDLLEGKRTAIVAHALEHSPRSDELHGLLADGGLDEDGIGRALGILTEAGSIAYVQGLMERLCDQAKDALVRDFGPTETRATIVALVDYIKDRMR